IASRIPIVLIGKKGLVSDFVITHNLGIFIEDKDVSSNFVKIPELIENLNYNASFDYSEYTFTFQTNLLINLLNS
ncbi:MAG: hypothetical protein EBV15_09605, partial [Bacteroidetes bacterium]|nr:hypothetical protein [Bacteroidota bacterium]